MHVNNSVGLVLQGGADYMLTRNWGLSLDVKKTFTYVQSHASGVDVGGLIVPAATYQHTNFQPWAFSAESSIASAAERSLAVVRGEPEGRRGDPRPPRPPCRVLAYGSWIAASPRIKVRGRPSR